MGIIVSVHWELIWQGIVYGWSEFVDLSDVERHDTGVIEVNLYMLVDGKNCLKDTVLWELRPAVVNSLT